MPAVFLDQMKTTSTKKTIYERIRELRKKRGLSQSQAAEMFNFSEPAWSRIERGKRGLSAILLANICEKWHVSADYILFGERDTEKQIDISDLTASQITAIKAIMKSFRQT